jgi:hypothetical protein
MASAGGNFNWSDRGASATGHPVVRDEVLGACSSSMQPPRTRYDRGRTADINKPLLSRGFGVELAGLEPATSWVRSRRSPN